jgi:hypothetical protein
VAIIFFSAAANVRHFCHCFFRGAPCLYRKNLVFLYRKFGRVSLNKTTEIFGGFIKLWWFSGGFLKTSWTARGFI